MIMASEILLNQPVKKNIKIIHNNFFINYLIKTTKEMKELKSTHLVSVFF